MDPRALPDTRLWDVVSDDTAPTPDTLAAAAELLRRLHPEQHLDVLDELVETAKRHHARALRHRSEARTLHPVLVAAIAPHAPGLHLMDSGEGQP